MGAAGPYRPNRRPKVPINCQMCPITERSICVLDGDELLVEVKRLKTADRILPAGSSLYLEGEPCSELYALVDGWVILYRILKSGNRQILDFVLPGSFLGYQPDLLAPMLNGAECLTDVAVCVFQRQRFARLLETYPSLAMRLASISSREAITARDHLTNVGARTAMARIAHLLLGLCTRLQSNTHISTGDTWELPLTQQHIGDALGLTSVYVSHTLKQLTARGLLAFKNGRLEILDVDGLASIVELHELFGVG